MKVGELFVQLGVDADTPEAKEFQSVINSISMESIALVAGLTAVSFKLKEMLTESMNAAVGFKLFNNSTGLSVEELQRWQIIAERANVSTESVTGSIMALQRSVAEIRLGRGNLMPFQLLGIDISNDPFKLLSQIREKLKGLDKAQAMNIMEMFGISPEMINVMALTNDQFEEFGRTQGLIFSKENQDNAMELKRNVTDLRLEFTALSRELVGIVGPLLKDDLKVIQQLAYAVNSLTGAFNKIPNLRSIIMGLIPGLNIGEGWKMGRGMAQKAEGLWNKMFNNTVNVTVTGGDPIATAMEIKRIFDDVNKASIDMADSQINNEDE